LIFFNSEKESPELTNQNTQLYIPQNLSYEDRLRIKIFLEQIIVQKKSIRKQNFTSYQLMDIVYIKCFFQILEFSVKLKSDKPVFLVL
jgi:hypothetical protein